MLFGLFLVFFVFFFSSRRRHTRLVSDWSSDVCSSDLRTGKLAWKYRFEGAGGGFGGASGLLTTAGGLLFADDAAGSLIAFGLRGRKSPVPLWHAHIG